MADSFLQFSAEIPKLKKKEREWAEAHLALFNGEPPKEGTPQADEFDGFIGTYQLESDDDYLGFEHAFENGGLWIYSKDGSGNPDHVAAFVQMFLKKFRPKDAFSLSWGTTCSRPLLDSFGGGAIFVTAEKVEWMNAWTWVDKKWEAFREK